MKKSKKSWLIRCFLGVLLAVVPLGGLSPLANEGFADADAWHAHGKAHVLETVPHVVPSSIKQVAGERFLLTFSEEVENVQGIQLYEEEKAALLEGFHSTRLAELRSTWDAHGDSSIEELWAALQDTWASGQDVEGEQLTLWEEGFDQSSLMATRDQDRLISVSLLEYQTRDDWFFRQTHLIPLYYDHEAETYLSSYEIPQQEQVASFLAPFDDDLGTSTNHVLVISIMMVIFLVLCIVPLLWSEATRHNQRT